VAEDKRNIRLITERKIVRNMSQAELAEATDIPQPTISAMELGVRPGAEHKEKLAAYFGKTVEYLFGEG
jgi:transcriptional regulator with XRE-family HTH domain